ncbi:MAG: hypothetical protein JO309_12965 [Pseudonocardiales bacterium]|nr:hypothetical protein [Pseudonocardiales bacterium]MBV9730288.1 hypothetical protein [Pseudonocardiales bacterium]
MARTVTLRLSQQAYEAVKRYAETEHTSMNSWIEGVLDAEDMRRRCAAHGEWLRNNPGMAMWAEQSARRNLANLSDVLPHVTGSER